MLLSTRSSLGPRPSAVRRLHTLRNHPTCPGRPTVRIWNVAAQYNPNFDQHLSRIAEEEDERRGEDAPCGRPLDSPVTVLEIPSAASEPRMRPEGKESVCGAFSAKR